MSHELTLFPKYAKSNQGLTRWRDEVIVRFEEQLRKDGQRLTAPRRKIVDHILSLKDHQTMEQISSAVKTKDPSVGRATVFRTIKLLEKMQVITRVPSHDGVNRYEPSHNRPHHDHMICVECGRIEEFHSDRMEFFQNEALKRHHFHPLWHRHEIYGRCEKCESKRHG